MCPASLAQVLDGAARRADDVPDVGVFGDDPERRGPRAADQDRRVGTLDRLGVATTDDTKPTSVRVKCGWLASRTRVSAPQVPEVPTSAARSSSPNPLGRRSSRWRRLRSRSPPVAPLRLAAGWTPWASAVNALKSGSLASSSYSRGVAAGGRPFSTAQPVGRSVAGSKSTGRHRRTARPSPAFAGRDCELVHGQAAVGEPDHVGTDAGTRRRRNSPYPGVRTTNPGFSDAASAHCAGVAGSMFLLFRNTLSGSYLAFTSASRR
jgi:hypothetical protein